MIQELVNQINDIIDATIILHIETKRTIISSFNMTIFHFYIHENNENKVLLEVKGDEDKAIKEFLKLIISKDFYHE